MDISLVSTRKLKRFLDIIVKRMEPFVCYKTKEEKAEFEKLENLFWFFTNEICFRIASHGENHEAVTNEPEETEEALYNELIQFETEANNE